MLDRFSDRTLEVATVIVVVVIALVILCYLAIFINPQIPINPFPPGTATAVAGVEATAFLPEVWTDTPTPTATNTATATATWTPTPTPTSTNTPVPPTATPTPTNTPTNTPPPPPPPAPPRPTATPTPWPYDWILAGTRPDCSWTGVFGYVVGANGLGEANVQMRAGNDQGWTADTKTNPDGWYAFQFAGGAKAGHWFVRVFKDGQPRSMQFWFDTSVGCTGPYSAQAFQIDWRHR